jgi:capsule biosynthesis phosphatase
MIYCFDLDDTICFPNHKESGTFEKYGKALPNEDIITFIRKAYESGHEIKIHTARRMLTHSGDLKKIEEDVGEITREWLTEHSVPYHSLIFGKPYADIYVDDKGMNVKDF